MNNNAATMNRAEIEAEMSALEARGSKAGKCLGSADATRYYELREALRALKRASK